MTGNIFFDALFIFLIVYAIIHICYEAGEFLVEKFSAYRHRDFLILPLSSGREALELDIRMAVKRSESCGCALMIIDEGLSKEEQTVLWRLADPYSHVVIAGQDNLADTIKAAEEINGLL